MGQRERDRETQGTVSKNFIVVFMWKNWWRRVNRLRIAQFGQFQWALGTGIVPGCLEPLWWLGQVNAGPESESHEEVVGAWALDQLSCVWEACSHLCCRPSLELAHTGRADPQGQQDSRCQSFRIQKEKASEYRKKKAWLIQGSTATIFYEERFWFLQYVWVLGGLLPSALATWPPSAQHPSSHATSEDNLSYPDATICHRITTGPLSTARRLFFLFSNIWAAQPWNLILICCYNPKRWKVLFPKAILRPITLSVNVPVGKKMEQDMVSHLEECRCDPERRESIK